MTTVLERTAAAAPPDWRALVKAHPERVARRRREYTLRRAVDWRVADFRFFFPGLLDGAVLNVGSDWGTISLALAESGAQVFALDEDAETRQFARARAAAEGLSEQIVFLESRENAGTFPLPDAAVDAVIMVDALEWWGHEQAHPPAPQVRALAEAWRVLRPGGWLHVAIENRYGYPYWLGAPDLHTGQRAMTLLPRSVARWWARRRGAPTPVWTPSWRELQRLLAAAGFAPPLVYWQLPGYRDFRYAVPAADRPQLRQVAASLGRENDARRRQGLVVQALVALRLERWFMPRFCLFARKPVH